MTPRVLLTAGATVPDYVATAAVLIAAALLTLAFGFLRRGRGFFPYAVAALYVLLGAAVYWPLTGSQFPAELASLAMWLGGAALVAYLVVQRRRRLDAEADFDSVREPAPDPGAARPSRLPRLYMLAALLLTALFLFDNLGGYAGTLLTWESPVIASPNPLGFADTVDRGIGLLSYVKDRFLWDNGILSAGNTSLFYGAPTYALFQVLGFSTWTLRVCAAIATLLSIVVIYVLARRFFGPIAGAAAAILLGLNAAVLFYGRYGSSPAGTMLAVLLAVLATWLFLAEERSAWWLAVVCAATLYLATVQYSPARIVVLILLGFTGLVLLLQWRRLWWRRAVGAAILIVAATGVWKIQTAYHTEQMLLFARGEQFLYFADQGPDYIKNLFGKDMVTRPFRGDGTLDPFGKLELLYNVLRVTVPGYVDLLDPRLPIGPTTSMLNMEVPLRLYYGPAALFILWGLVYSLFHLRSWTYACLVVWIVANTVPLLITNRVDAHRMMLFVIPLSLWGAVGAREAARVLAEARVPIGIRHLIAVALLVTLVYHLAVRFRYPEMPAVLPGYVFANEMARTPGPVLAGSMWDHREASWLRLQMLERERRDPRWVGEMLHDFVLRSVSNESSMPSELSVRDLVRKLDRYTILVGPAERFQKFAAVMQRNGARVAERGEGQLRILRIDGGAAASGVPDEIVVPLPAIILAPTPTPLALLGGSQIAVTDLPARDVQFGFAPPQTGQTWDQQPIRMGGQTYARGIGVHAWTRMTYDVPPRARTFQAVVGLSDSTKVCGAPAAVTFEIRNERGELLYDSGRIDTETAPKVAQVDLKGAKAITLEVTEGGNGRDCDHANWGQPVFLVE